MPRTVISHTLHSHHSMKCPPLYCFWGTGDPQKQHDMGAAGYCRRGELLKIPPVHVNLFDGNLPSCPTWITMKSQIYPCLMQNCKRKHFTANQVPHPNARVYMRTLQSNINQHTHALFCQMTAKCWQKVTLNLHNFVSKLEISSVEVPTPHTIAELGKQSCKLLMKHLSLS